MPIFTGLMATDTARTMGVSMSTGSGAETYGVLLEHRDHPRQRDCFRRVGWHNQSREAHDGSSAPSANQERQAQVSLRLAAFRGLR